MSEFKIEHDIPIPPSRGRTKYPFDQMQVGDSFLSRSHGVTSATGYYAKLHPGVKFRQRKVSGGWRVWRIA